MASRQRSFFDQKPATRPWHNRWPRRRDEHHPLALPQPAPPPIAASSQSRRKLRAFRYQPDPRDAMAAAEAAAAYADATKENRSGDGRDMDRMPSKARDRDAHVTSPAASHRRGFPQTPVARVPFADLVENGETVTAVSPVRTPPEGVTWRQSPTSSDVSQLARSQRGTKRARSSSPPSSQRSQHHLLLQPTFGLRDLHANYRAGGVSARGDIDPTLDLEARYFGGATRIVTPSKLPSSAAADLMHSSSPRTPGLGLTDSAKLRRTRSCGIAFPTSDHKRRRITKSHSHVGHKSPTHTTAQQQRDPKISKMSRLLDKVDQGLLDRSNERQATQSSGNRTGFTSLFSPDTPAHANGVPGAGPIAGLGVHIAMPRGSAASAAGEQEAYLNILSQEVARTSLHVRADDQSSDYGGHELDDLVGVTEDKRKPDELLLKQSSLESTHNKNPALTQPETREETDDFDDDHDDDFMDNLTAAELENLVASCGPPGQTQAATQTEHNAAHVEVTQEEIRRAKHESEQDASTIALAAQPPAAAVIDLSSDEEFGGDEFDDIARECDELAHVAEQSSTTGPLIPRYTVKNVSQGVYTSAKGLSQSEKLLHVQDERTQARRTVALREAWLDSPVVAGCTVHVQANFDARGSTVVDNAHGLLIVHPDHLVSATVVADAFKCPRRAVLQERVKATSAVNESQVLGHILHEVFQAALAANRWDAAWLEDEARRVVPQYLERLFELQLPTERCVAAVCAKLEGAAAWAAQFVVPTARPNAQLAGPAGGAAAVGPVAINKLLDVEEHVWSPRYGLKGNIDATVQIHAPAANATWTVPFELKTGRAVHDPAHHAQTALYTLLLADRYDVQPTIGLLHYLETQATSPVSLPRRDLVHMLMQRNELASYARSRAALPPMLRRDFTCARCYAQSACFTYHKLTEGGDGNTSGLGSSFVERTAHLKPAHAAFFTKWDELLTREEADVLRFRRELWSMESDEREKLGRCFGGVVIKPGSAVERAELPKINRFEYVFVRPVAVPGFSFAESQLNVGEPIVISDEEGHYALANGYVTRIRAHEMAVAVDRRLHNARTRSKDFDPATNQSFAGIMDLTSQYKPSAKGQIEREPTVFRIDKDEFSNGMATVRNNLVCMMEKELFGANMLRRLVVEGVSPTFRTESPNDIVADPHQDLNVDQRAAIRKVMAADHYALVLGMPGTGKTTTIAHIIRALLARGKSVLLTSYTHTAVDNILLKIRDVNARILRIGAESKVHPEVQSFADLACRPRDTFEALERAYQSEVVATTCLGINHPLFNQRTFDYCIVDEASQITLPVCLGPIRMAHRFVLVGDHFQLPPLVQNKEAQEGGLDVSLFKLLSDEHPHSVVNLEHQYRMCADIMSLSNSIVYDGRLKCGTPAVATRTLPAPKIADLQQHHHQDLSSLSASRQARPCLGPSCWLRDTLDPARPVLFLNTDAIGDASRDVVMGSRITNPFEVALTAQVVRALLTVGVPASEVGVMTLYRSQLALLRQALRPRSSLAQFAGSAETLAALEMHTADKFQGRDKEAVVLSLVRSNANGNVGDLLQDWRRLNVALTRARTKLVIIGSMETVRKGSGHLEQLCRIIDANGWRIDLRPGTLEEHCFEEAVTQLSGIGAAAAATNSKSPSRSVTGSKSTGNSPLKRGRGLPVEKILKRRPVLQNIVDGVIG